jgi:hypothetical protein
MGTLKDLYSFEKHNLGYMWDALKSDPKRLILGVDPASTELWNQILGRDDKPIVNFLGGPMGSGWTGMGETGGVYESARNDGINTKHSESSHDVAEAIAAYYGSQGAAGGLGAAWGGGAAAGGASGSGAAGGGLLSAGDAAAMEAASASAGMSAGGGTVNAGMGMSAPAQGINWGGVAEGGAGLLGAMGQSKPQQQPAAISPPPQNNNQNLQHQMQRARRMQELRAKPRKSLAEQQELQELMRNGQGLL